MRLFVALFPSDAVRDDLKGRLTRAERKLRLTPADRWHITLSFLGEVPDEQRADVERALSGVSAKGPITLRLVGGGQFGHGRSSAVWAGVEGDLATLQDLHQEIRAALDVDGLPCDDRPLTPHLTLSYMRERAMLSALEGYLSPQWTADEFVLVRSHYRDGGGYEPLRSWPLGP